MNTVTDLIGKIPSHSGIFLAMAINTRKGVWLQPGKSSLFPAICQRFHPVFNLSGALLFTSLDLCLQCAFLWNFRGILVSRKSCVSSIWKGPHPILVSLVNLRQGGSLSKVANNITVSSTVLVSRIISVVPSLSILLCKALSHQKGPKYRQKKWEGSYYERHGWCIVVFSDSHLFYSSNEAKFLPIVIQEVELFWSLKFAPRDSFPASSFFWKMQAVSSNICTAWNVDILSNEGVLTLFRTPWGSGLQQISLLHAVLPWILFSQFLKDSHNCICCLTQVAWYLRHWCKIC